MKGRIILQFQEFLKLYPTATLHTVPTKDSNFISLPYQDHFIWLEKASLNEKEQLLLSLTILPTSPITDATTNPWYPVLFEHYPIKENGHYRLIQVTFNQTEHLLTKEWLAEVHEMLPSVVDCFFTSTTQAIIIEQQQENLTRGELDGLFLALDMDFDCYTHLFVGPFHHSSHDFTRLLEEETVLFQKLLQRNISEKSTDLAASIIHLFGEPQLTSGILFSSLFQDWFTEDETMPELIAALWQNKGNVSSAAKDLFMHRNTLLYKLEKFQQNTQLNLKEMDDLLLSYLLTQTFITF